MKKLVVLFVAFIALAINVNAQINVGLGTEIITISDNRAYQFWYPAVTGDITIANCFNVELGYKYSVNGDENAQIAIIKPSLNLCTIGDGVHLTVGYMYAQAFKTNTAKMKSAQNLVTIGTICPIGHSVMFINVGFDKNLNVLMGGGIKFYLNRVKVHTIFGR
jgi:hypothetical protein